MLASVEQKPRKIQGLTAEEKRDLMREYGLPAVMLEIDSKHEKDFGKFYHIVEYNGKTFYTLCYDRTSPVVSAQFQFHLKLLRTLQQKPYFSYTTHTFEDLIYHYIVFVPETSSTGILAKLKEFEFDHLRTVFRLIATVFEELEAAGVVFTHVKDAEFLITAAGIIQLNPLDLAYGYKAGQECYASVGKWFALQHYLGGSSGLVRNLARESFGLMKADKAWNVYFFSELIEVYAEKTEGRGYNTHDKWLLKYFHAKVKALNEIIRSDMRVDYGWDLVKEFVDEFAQSGVLKDFIPDAMPARTVGPVSQPSASLDSKEFDRQISISTGSSYKRKPSSSPTNRSRSNRNSRKSCKSPPLQSLSPQRSQDREKEKGN